MEETEFTTEDLEGAKSMAHKMCMDSCQRNIDWVLAVRCNIAFVDTLLEDYKNWKDQYKFKFWFTVKSELLKMDKR